MLPLTIVTGFLGSGKTTLIGRLLRHPGFRRTAVIVSEFGEIGLDHELIASSDDTIMTLGSGCVCCAMQTDLSRTIMDLFERRRHGLVEYDRVLLETSGLSDPGPVLLGLMRDPAVQETHQIPYVVALVDAVNGEHTLRNHAEACRQVIFSDAIVISKTDVQAASRALLRRIDALNPTARLTSTTTLEPDEVFGLPSFEAVTSRLDRAVPARGHGDVVTSTIIRDHPLPALVLSLLLPALSEHCGERLLRLKGLIAVEEMPGRPAMIHGVRHVFAPAEFLDRWPSEDHRTRIVVITNDVPRYFAARLLDAIEEEVRDAYAASGSPKADAPALVRPTH